MALAALTLSGLALIVALASAWFTRAQAAAALRQATADETLARIETDRHEHALRAVDEAARAARRAHVRVYVEGHGTGYIVVDNRGPASARRVFAEVVAAIDGGTLPDVEPIYREELKAGEAARSHFSLAFGKASEVVCQLSWRDGDDNHDERVELRLGAR